MNLMVPWEEEDNFSGWPWFLGGIPFSHDISYLRRSMESLKKMEADHLKRQVFREQYERFLLKIHRYGTENLEVAVDTKI